MTLPGHGCTQVFDPARPERALSEGPQRPVVLTKPFYMGVHEVTQRQYERVSGTNPSWWSVTGGGRDRIAGRDTSDSPVENVSWVHATSWCNLLSKAEQLQAAYQITADSTTAIAGAGYRLPTEAEWEYACRAGTSTLFWSGDDEASLKWAAWYGGNNTPDLPKAVGTRAANPFGLHDVHGNVWEWVHDGWDPFFYQRLVGSTASDPRSEIAIDGRRVMRGGDYFMSAAECRSGCRDGYHANTQFEDLGFRLALSVEAVRKLIGSGLLNAAKPGDSFKELTSKPESTVTEAASSKKSPADGEPGVLYSDDFSYRKSNLPQTLRDPDEKNQPIGEGFGEGVYFMQERTTGNWGIDVRGDLVDFSCECVGRVLRDKPEAHGSWGILLRARERGLQILINSEGQLLIQPSFWTANAYPNDPRIGPVVHPAIRSGDQFNTLRLNVRRRRLEVLVNNVPVCPPVLLDWDLTPTLVEFGLRVDAPKIRAEFDRIELKVLPPDTTVPVRSALGSWMHHGNERIDLRPDGALEGSLDFPRRKWSQTGPILTLRHAGREGGEWIDRVELDGDGTHYRGANQYFLEIWGFRVPPGSTTNSIGITMNPIPAGEFDMGISPTLAESFIKQVPGVKRDSSPTSNRSTAFGSHGLSP